MVGHRYSVEIIYLPRIMNNTNLFKEITKESLEEMEEISNDVNQYMDDSTNDIGAKSMEDIKISV